MAYNGSGTFLINTAGQPVVSGTVISSTAFNALTADLATGLSTAITKDGQTTVTANIPMSTYKFTGLGVGSAATDSANLSQVQSTVTKLLNSVSGADTITATASPTLAAYAAGQMFYFVAAGDNTTSVTLNIDSLGAKAVTRDGATALAAADIKSGEVVVVVYDGTRFQVVSQLNSAGDARFANVSIASSLYVGGVSTFVGNAGFSANVSIASALSVGGVAAITGATTIGGNLTLSGGTANGVLYLNGSKVATSGSALTFDGTNLGIGTSSPGYKLTVAGGATSLAANQYLRFGAAPFAAGDGSLTNYLFSGTTSLTWRNAADSADLMYLSNSGNLGLGTSSPVSRLTIYDNAPAFTMQTSRSFTTNRNWQIGVDTFAEGNWTLTPSTTLGGNTYTTPALTVNPSGNLGLGVTPSAWSASGSVFQMVRGYIRSDGNTTSLGNNAYYNGSNWIYSANGYATYYDQYANTGAHAWFNSASGTAGNTISFTQAMTLDASGNLVLGETSTSYRFQIGNGTTTGVIRAGTAVTSIDSGYQSASVYGTAAAPALIFGGDDNTGIWHPASDVLAISTGGSERARITSDGTFLVRGGSVPAANAYDAPFIFRIGGGGLGMGSANETGSGAQIAFYTLGTERARITSGGAFLVGTTNEAPGQGNVAGVSIRPANGAEFSQSSTWGVLVNRATNDGDLVLFYQDGTQEGSISVSGNTVSYNAFAGSHWSQLQDGSKPDILRGTVMESINELCVWPGEQNERLPKSKVSDTAGSKKVYGVFMAWDNDWATTNDMYITAVGAFICRVNGSVTVQEGDLLESNGDGTARVQADDIIRSSTIGKVTSTVKTHQYADGSYCVPTVLYCG